MKKTHISRHEQRWHELYDAVVSDDHTTIECVECGATMLGDGQIIKIVCLDCWKAHHAPDPIGELMDATDKAAG